MHVIFIPYGKRSEVELLLRDMESQKFQLKMKRGVEEQAIYIQGVIRVLPLGVYEYIFPKEYLDIVLTTLEFDKMPYDIPKMPLDLIMRYLKIDKIPDFKKDNKYLWIKDHTAIIPLGIREDADLLETEGKMTGWTHEAL
jgi:hypothetical protein